MSAIYTTPAASARFVACLAFIIAHEGREYTNDPDDRGGATCCGIIQREYDLYRHRKGLPLRSVQFITEAEYTEIYHDKYWMPSGADSLAPGYDLAVFNAAVNSGLGAAHTMRSDVEATNPGADGLTLARAFCDRYERYYQAIVRHSPSQSKWLRGWLNRLADCRHEIEEVAALAASTPDAAGTWTVFLSDKPIGTAITEGGSSYFSVRTFLEALFPKAEVTAGLLTLHGSLNWHGQNVPVTTIVRTVDGQPVGYGKMRDLAAWMKLDLLVNGKDRQIDLSRGSGAAKAMGQF